MSEQRCELLRESAAELEHLGAQVYPEDVFIPPTRRTLHEVNQLLQRERGHMLDGIAAECYRRAIRLCAHRLRELADAEQAT